MFREQEKFSPKTMEAFQKTINRAWLTRQYFAKGKHDLVLPGWLIGLLGPDGAGNHGIAGSLELTNTDLRSYYALGSPRSEQEPVVDFTGGIIPLPESYTLIFGTVIESPNGSRPFYSSEVGEVNVVYDDGFPVCTVYWEVDGDVLVYDTYTDRDEETGSEALSIHIVRGFANHPLLVALLPMDQDGTTYIPTIDYDSKAQVVSFNDELPEIRINQEEVPIRVTSLPISQGHAGRLVIEARHDSYHVECPAGLASWSAQFPVRSTPLFTIVLDGDPPEHGFDFDDIKYDWEDLLDEKLPTISTSNEEVDYFFKSSATVLRLLADTNQREITVGPSVQERMWIPALVFQARALDRLGFHEDVVKPLLDNMQARIDSNGVVEPDKQFDSQGALVIAFINHYYRTNDKGFIGDKYSAIKRVTEWVSRQRKRAEEGATVDQPVLGLLPPGHASWFNPLYWKLDYFYSHNFWAAGMLAYVIDLASDLGKHADAEKYEPELDKYRQDLDDSITLISEGKQYLPAGPYQRDNAQMIFNLYAYYPLKLYQPLFQQLHNTLDWLWNNYTHDGGVLIDQPWNAYGSYFSMLMAQAWRYVGDANKVEEIIKFLITNATNRSGWAEGISPLTRLGSVGDSPNGIAAAEFVNLVLDLFAEDHRNHPPILLKGMPVSWLRDGVKATDLQLFFNGLLDIEAKIDGKVLTVTWDLRDSTKPFNPILYIPKSATKLPSNVEQLSTNEIQLDSTAGTVEIALDL